MILRTRFITFEAPPQKLKKIKTVFAKLLTLQISDGRFSNKTYSSSSALALGHIPKEQYCPYVPHEPRKG